MNRFLCSLVSTLFLFTLLISGVQAGNGDNAYGNDILVDYYGNQVSLRELETKRDIACHDARGQGHLTCFDSSTEAFEAVIALEKAPPSLLNRVESSEDTGTSGQTERQQTNSASLGGGTCYAGLWSEKYLAGSLFIVCYDYNSLGAVGWNDRARSLDVFEPTTVWEHNNYTGDHFSTAVTLPNLAEWNFDRKMSSINRRL